MKAKQAKFNKQKARRALGKQTLTLMALLELGQTFDHETNGSITGYGLGETVEAIAEKIIRELTEANLLQNYDAFPEDVKAALHFAQRVDYLLSGIAAVVKELSHDSHIEEVVGESHVGTVLYAVALEAGRNLDRAINALDRADKGHGFSDENFNID